MDFAAGFLKANHASACQIDVDDLAEDPLPDYGVDSLLPEHGVDSAGIITQESKRKLRPSFYTFNDPGLPEGAPSAPNRCLHEAGQESMVKFMHEVQRKPQMLSHKIAQKRAAALVQSQSFDQKGSFLRSLNRLATSLGSELASAFRRHQ
eukprot:Skav214482  [mRNA]  locus=scaffold1167:405791:412415:+ [translate_table: standard]